MAITTDHQARFGLVMGELSRAWRSRINGRLARFGLTYAKWTVLRSVIEEPGGLRQGELARALSIEGPTLVRLVDQLESDGWVERVTDGRDRRAKRIVPATGASRRLRAVSAAVSAVRRDALADFTRPELSSFIEHLERLRTRLRQAP